MKKYIIFAIVAAIIIPSNFIAASSPGSCVDVQFLFARGSGAPHRTSSEHQAFETAVRQDMQASTLTYQITDLEYPAVSVDNLGIILSAYINAGSAGKFADSVREGTQNLYKFYHQITSVCPTTKWILFGYSQGAKVIATTLEKLAPESIAYAAFFGDPNLYLPEGEGTNPPACQGKNLSTYRMHAPDCSTDTGIFGARQPYVPATLTDKIGLWCNDDDLICGSSKNLFVTSGHLNYANDKCIPTAVKLAIQKILHPAPGEITARPTVPKDSIDAAFVIDGSARMLDVLPEYRREVFDQASKTLQEGGRIALLYFRNRTTTKLCDFDCSLSEFIAKYDSITAYGQYQSVQNILGASRLPLSSLSWRHNINQTTVLLTKRGLRTYPNTNISPSPRTKSAKTTALSSLAPTQSPISPPANLQISTTPDNQIQLTWQNPTAATHTLLIADGAILGRLPAATTSITLTNLDPSTTHEFILYSLDASHNLSKSSTISVKAQVKASAPIPPILKAPQAGAK